MEINLVSTQNKFRIIVLVAGLIILMIIILVVRSLTTKKQPERFTPGASIAPNTIVPPQRGQPLPQEVANIKTQIIAKQIENKGGDIVLLKSDNYSIRYIPSPDVFFVTILKDQALQYKKETQNWFLSFGLKQEDLCNLPVRFMLGNFELRKNNPDFSSLPDGCTGSPLEKP